MNNERANEYDFNAHIAERYDRFETETDDVELIRSLVEGQGPLRVLEPFCGTGRILIPLAVDGHEMTGMDQSETMLSRARAKISAIGAPVRARIALAQADVLEAQWPSEKDLVILGGNCFYELASADEQELCIRKAAASLAAGGYVYVDNDHMEGDLDERWRRPGVRKTFFPSGVCADGARLEATSELLWFDAPGRLVRNRRNIVMTLADGSQKRWSCVHQRHPVSAVEVSGWLEKHGFAIEKTFGDRSGRPYAADSPRAIFWACKASQP